MNDLRYAFRQLLKNPGFTAVAVLTLALGMGANTTFFSVFHGVVLQSPPYPDSARLIELRHRFDREGREERFSLAELFDLRERQRSLTGIGAFISGRATLTSEQGADRVQLARITANVFPLLGVSPARGRGFTEEEEHAGRDTAVVVSDDFWKTELGGAQDVIGRDLRINGERHTVVGVMPAGFSYPGPGISIWKPLDLNRRGAADRDDHSLQVIARIAPGVSMADARRDLEEISKRLQVELPAAYPARDTRWHFALESLRASQFGHMTAPLGLLAAAAATVLLIACVNVSIMFLLRAGMRRREMTIRYALGAGRHHLLKQLLIESALVCGLGAIGGVLIATFGLRALKVFSPDQIPRLQEVALNGPVAVFTGGVLMLVTLVVGLVPAVAAFNAGATGGNAATARATDSRAAGRLREGLTVVQIALAVVLLVCAGLTVRSLNGLSRVDLGFATGELFAFKTNLTPQGHPDAARANRFYDQLAEKLERLPGVTAVGAVSYLPLSGEAQYTAASADTAQASRNSGNAPLNAGWRVVRGRYFEAMKMTLVRGRFFTAADREQSTPVVIVDDAFARKFWPTEDAAVGKTVRFGDAAKPDIRTVVGVVRRVKHFGPGADSAPEAYVPQAQVYQRGMYSVVEAGGSPANLAPLIRKALAEIDPTVPMYFADTLEQRRRAAFTLPRFTAGLTGAFSVLALILAGVGLFGVTAYSVGQRSREFGIRVSLGAQRSHVAGLVLGRVGWLALFGSAVGVPAAFVASKLMTRLLFGVGPADIPTLAATTMGIGVTVILASAVPLLRALRVNPVEVLKAE